MSIQEKTASSELAVNTNLSTIDNGAQENNTTNYALMVGGNMATSEQIERAQRVSADTIAALLKEAASLEGDAKTKTLKMINELAGNVPAAEREEIRSALYALKIVVTGKEADAWIESIPAPQGADLETTWKIRTLKDAYKEREPLQYVIEGVFARASLNVVYGAPGSLKSMILADACVCVAGGHKWLEALPVDKAEQGATFATKQAAVLWIDYDNGTRRTDERFDALARVRNIPEDAPLHYVSMATPWIDASNENAVKSLATLIESLQAELVVIDNLGLITGEVEENSAQMSQVMGNLRWLAEESKAAIVVIHHQRKGSNDKARAGESLRGHSSIEAALDLALMVERKQNTDQIAVIPTKERGFSVPAFGAMFTYQHKPGSKDLQHARFFADKMITKKERENSLIEGAVTSILKQLSKGEVATQSDLVTGARDSLALTWEGGSVPGVNRVRGAIKQMIGEGKVLTKTGEKGALLHYLPGQAG